MKTYTVSVPKRSQNDLAWSLAQEGRYGSPEPTCAEAIALVDDRAVVTDCDRATAQRLRGQLWDLHVEDVRVLPPL